jgi:hypothetical protein
LVNNLLCIREKIKLLKNYNPVLVLFLGTVLLFLLGMLFFLVEIKPLGQEIGESQKVKASLSQELASLEIGEGDNPRIGIKSFELAGALAYLQDLCESKALEVEEISISSIADPDQNLAWEKTELKLSVRGNWREILSLLTTIEELNIFPFLIQEIDMTGTRAVVVLQLWVQN